MRERYQYILRISVQLATGCGAVTVPEEEQEEARRFLDGVGVLLPNAATVAMKAAA